MFTIKLNLLIKILIMFNKIPRSPVQSSDKSNTKSLQAEEASKASASKQTIKVAKPNSSNKTRLERSPSSPPRLETHKKSSFIGFSFKKKDKLASPKKTQEKLNLIKEKTRQNINKYKSTELPSSPYHGNNNSSHRYSATQLSSSVSKNISAIKPSAAHTKLENLNNQLLPIEVVTQTHIQAMDLQDYRFEFSDNGDTSIEEAVNWNIAVDFVYAYSPYFCLQSINFLFNYAEIKTIKKCLHDLIQFWMTDTLIQSDLTNSMFLFCTAQEKVIETNSEAIIKSRAPYIFLGRTFFIDFLREAILPAFKRVVQFSLTYSNTTQNQVNEIHLKQIQKPDETRSNEQNTEPDQSTESKQGQS